MVAKPPIHQFIDFRLIAQNPHRGLRHPFFNFTLIACMVSSVMGLVWYLHSGASFHMTGNTKYLSILEEKDLKIHIEIRDERRYSATGISIVTFQREFGTPITLKYFMYVPGLKKNLVFLLCWKTVAMM